MESDRVDTTPLSLTQIFDKACPQFMAIGLSYQDFWYGDPAFISVYIQADKARQERENFNFWLQGIYQFKATETAITNGLIDAGLVKGRKHPFMDKPIAFDGDKKTKRETIINKLKNLSKGANNGK